MTNQPALTRLRFKNWRSLRDVTIDNLTPITVFVGANSSGKTNIFDAFRFLRDVENKGGTEAAYAWRIREKIRTMGASDNESVELGLFFAPRDSKQTMEWQLEVKFARNELSSVAIKSGSRGPMPYDQADAALDQTTQFIGQRWQLLQENFMPLSTIPSESDLGSFYLIDPSVRNTSSMLYFMEKTQPEVYDTLQTDLRWLLSHVEKTEAEQDDNETRLVVRETVLKGEKALTISAGTARIIAMLTAYYALDMRTPELPGLVVIEEPDTAIHPLLLQKFVELLRGYTEKENPRQFILTTHNPMFLNFFKPEEVRIVERNEQGETTVSNVDMDVANVWLEHDGAYNLGNLWTTRLLGGVP